MGLLSRTNWIILATIVIGILFIWWFSRSDNSIYTRNFGDHKVKIWISADDAGSGQKKIHGSYHERGFVLMYGYNSVDLPATFETPTFSTVVDESNQLVCIFDNNDYGFLMIVDQSDHDWCIGGMSGGVKLSGPEKWQQHFETLLQTDPEIPYADYFDRESKNAG